MRAWWNKQRQESQPTINRRRNYDEHNSAHQNAKHNIRLEEMIACPTTNANRRGKTRRDARNLNQKVNKRESHGDALLPNGPKLSYGHWKASLKWNCDFLIS
jgi:hypothetical protein